MHRPLYHQGKSYRCSSNTRLSGSQSVYMLCSEDKFLASAATETKFLGLLACNIPTITNKPPRLMHV
jgi:hypothetical protein